MGTTNSGKMVIFYGVPNCGKGTQAKKLVDEFSFKYLGMGDMLRKRKETDESFNYIYGSMMDKGLLIPDFVVIETFYKALKNVPVGSSVVLDGVPRTVDQAGAVKSLLVERGGGEANKINLVRFVLDPQNARKRSLARGREDSSGKVFEKRMEEFHKHNKEFMDYCSKAGFMINEVYADGTVEDVWQRLLDVVKPL